MHQTESAARRRKRVLIAVCGAAVLLLGGLVTAALVLLESPTGVAVALRAAALAGLDVRFHNPSGRLLDAFGLEQLEIRAGATRIVVNDLQARVSHWSLQPLRIGFDSIRASKVEVHAGPAQPGHAPPRRIASPVPWEVGELQVELFEYWGARDLDAASLRLQSVRAGLLSSADGYRVNSGRLEAAGSELELAGTVGAVWPFPLQATGRIRSRLAQRPVQANWTASGSLDQLEVSATLTGSDVGGRVQARLSSFATPHLTRVEADLQGLDPANWKAGAPHAQLDIRVDVRPVAGRPSELAGTFDARNRADGTLDAQRIPIRSLRGTLAADFDAAAGATIALPAIEAELERGSATGRIDINTRGGVERWSVDAAFHQLDLSRLHSRMRPLRVDGRVHVDNRATEAGVGFAARGDLRARVPVTAELTFDLDGGVDRLSLTSAHLALNAGTFDANGLFERRTNQLQLHGSAHSLDAGLLLQTVRTRIDGRFDVDAALTPEPHGVGRFELVDSRICWPMSRCWPASGQGVVELSPDRQLKANVDLALHTARVQAHGALAGSQGRLEIAVTAPQLADLDPALHGTAEAHGVLSGSWDRPDVDLHASLRALRVSGQALASASLDLRGRFQHDAPFELVASVEGLGPETSAQPWLQSSALHAQGTLHEHTVSLQAAVTGPRRVTLLARGGLSGNAWAGVLAQADVDGPQPLHLSEATLLRADASGFSLGPAGFDAVGASVRDALFEYRSQVLVTRGDFDGLRLPQVGPLASVSLDAGDDPLKLRGHWNLTLGERANGQIAIDRESGDLRPALQGTAPTALGLRELSAQIGLDDGLVRARFSMDSERAGSLKASVQAAMQRGQDRNWGLDRTQPWHLEVAGRLPAIEALEPFFSQRVRANLRVAGRLAVGFRIDGTPEQPQASGSIEGDDLHLAWIDQGIRLQDGRLRARVEGDRMRIEELRFDGPLRVAPADRRARDALRGNPVGSVSASGQVSLSDLTGSLKVQARQLPVLQRADRWLVVSGDGKVELAPRRVNLNATLAADAGFLDLSRPDIPTLSDDVHVIQPTGAAAARTPAVTIGMDLGIDLGSAFYLRGNGLDAHITGPLRLQGEGQQPLRVNGAVSVEQGTYEGFGQRLTIRYGRVNFQGPADNPGLDVLAVRTDLPVEVGVAVTGSVSRPIVRLHSDPPLPDYETLSWLALGRAPSDPRTDNVALARLATGLLSGSGEGIPTRLARSIGIDEINLRSADAPANGTLLPRQSVAGKLTADETTTAATATNQIISLGHRINDAITVSYEQTVTGASNVVQVSYQLSRRLSLIGRAGSDNALNLVFSLPFD